MAMTAHIVYTGIDPENCATQSTHVINTIRTDMSFDGLIMTDDLSMKALKGSFADRCDASFNAGCDIVLHCNGLMDEMVQVAEASPKLSSLAHTRANRALDMRKTPESINIEVAKDQFHSMMHVVA